MLSTTLFCIFLLAVGVYFRRKTKDAAGYFLAGRGLNAWQVGLSMAATSFGSSAILVASWQVYTKGLPGIWFSLAVALGFIASGLWFAGRVRASGAHSLADFVGRLHGDGVRWVFSVLIVIVQLGFFALTVKAFSYLTQPEITNATWVLAHKQLTLAIVCAIFVAYPMLGGQKADVFSNIVKVIAVCIVMLGILLPRAIHAGNLTQLPRGWLAFPVSKTAGPAYVLNMLVLMGLPGIVGGDVFTLILSARDERAARRGMLLAGLTRLVLSAGVAALVLYATVLLPPLKGLDVNLAIPLLARQLLPGALFQLLTLIFMMSLIATGDTVLLTASTVLALDVFKLGERASPTKSRLITLGLAAVGLTLAIGFPDLVTLMTFSYTLLSAALIMPVIGMLLAPPERRPGAAWVIYAILAGAAGAGGWKIAQTYSLPAEALTRFPWTLDPVVIGVAASAALVFAGTLARKSE